MFSRINIFGIIGDHFYTLRRYDSSSRSISIEDFCLFILLPFIVSIMLTTLSVRLDSHVTDLITSISILGGFLFNLLAIIYGLIDKIKDSNIDTTANTEEAIRERIRQRFIKEIHVNISFNIVISLFILLLLVIYSYTLPVQSTDILIFYSTKFKIELLINRAISLAIYFFLGVFSLTMLMIINRVYIILNRE